METLVMIPGLGSDAAVWQRTILKLEHVVRCVVGDTHNDDTLAGMAQRILASAPQTFSLAGVSMGGMVALEMLKVAPERIKRLALVDTNARPDTSAQKARRHLNNWIVTLAWNFAGLSEHSLSTLVHPSASPDIRSEIVRMSMRVGRKAYIRQNRAVMARTDFRPLLHQISIPTAVIVGDTDRLTPLNLSQEIHALVRASTLHVIPDCGHLPPIEQPATMAKILLELIERNQSAEASPHKMGRH